MTNISKSQSSTIPKPIPELWDRISGRRTLRKTQGSERRFRITCTGYQQHHHIIQHLRRGRSRNQRRRIEQEDHAARAGRKVLRRLSPSLPSVALRIEIAIADTQVEERHNVLFDNDLACQEEGRQEGQQAVEFLREPIVP